MKVKALGKELAGLEFNANHFLIMSTNAARYPAGVTRESRTLVDNS